MAHETSSDSADHSFGVFKPVDHVVMSFPDAAHTDAAEQALRASGATVARRFSDREMLEQIDRDLAQASPLASIGQELNLVKAHQALARLGYHWLVVHAESDTQAHEAASIGRAHGAERAQWYGNFVIEELIQRPTDLPDVAESPDRGLDAQTPSGEEGERAAIRPSRADAR